jgi:very-short-patch-repair endonuclease
MTILYNTKTKKDLRKQLRKFSTPQEIILWSRLRRKQMDYKFKRQYSIGKYVVDFCCPERKLIVELDGWQHRKENNDGYDKERTRYLEDLGFAVLRFWNNEVNKNLEGVILRIEEHLK